MKLKYLALSAVLALVSLSSCSDFLDKVPDTRVDLQTVEQLRELMVDGYMPYNYALVGELSSDNVIDNNSPDANGVRYNLSAYDVADDEVFAWEDVKMGLGSDTPSGIWEGCYHSIAVANAVLEAADEIEAKGITTADKEKLQAVRGEAYLVRAYHHFILANFFCMPYRGEQLSKNDPGVPYITKPETEVKPNYERGTVAETYAMIEKDILAGLPLIDDGIYEVPKYHFNKAAANAFAARFYLFKREYEKVIDYATASLKGNDPLSICSDLWKQEDLYYIRDIGRHYTSVNAPNVMLCISSYSTWWRRMLGYRYTCNREAKRATIQGPGPSWNNCRYYYTRGKDRETFAMNPCFMSVCGTAGQQEYGTYFAGTAFEQFEYTDKIAGIGYCHYVTAEFTTEQTLLDRAEAYLFLGNTEAAFEDIHTWDLARADNTQKNTSRWVEITPQLIEQFYSKRDLAEDDEPVKFGIVVDFHIDEVCPSERYHLTPEMDNMMQCIQHFRRIETVHTGRRWWDIKRYGLSITHKIGINDSKTLQVLDPRYAIQIPTEVLSAGMQPNPRVSSASNTSEAAIRSTEYSIAQ